MSMLAEHYPDLAWASSAGALCSNWLGASLVGNGEYLEVYGSPLQSRSNGSSVSAVAANLNETHTFWGSGLNTTYTITMNIRDQRINFSNGIKIDIGPTQWKNGTLYSGVIGTIHYTIEHVWIF